MDHGLQKWLCNRYMIHHVYSLLLNSFQEAGYFAYLKVILVEVRIITATIYQVLTVYQLLCIYYTA